jgi:thioredoxin reductase
MHQALLIPDWGPTTLFTNGIFAPDDHQRKQLQAREVTVERALVTEISGQHPVVHLGDGRAIELAGLFVASKTRPSSPLAAQLGCEFVEGPLGVYIKTDGTQETSVSGVFACGDTARASGSITFAIADGAMAGAGTHRSLIFSSLG